MAKTAILYARVSKREQAEGYSLRQQESRLREYAAGQGYEIVHVESCPGEANDSIDWEARPGLSRVREMVEAGGIDLVLAQDADRIVRDPVFRAYLDEDMAKYGTNLRAMDDWGDDSHEGQLLKFIKGWAAKGERLKIAQRSHRNTVQRAKEGKVLLGRTPSYGFSYDANTGKLIVNEDQMTHVREIFRRVGVERQSLRGVKAYLERLGVRPLGYARAIASGQTPPQVWHPVTIKRMIENDVYRPHSKQELSPLLTPSVAAELEDGKRYGISWFNRTKTEKKAGKRVHHGFKDESAWVAVPVPDSGIPREWVDEARRVLAENLAPKAKNRRDWQLKGVLRCPCGSRMRPATRLGGKRDQKPSFYYVCERYHTDGRKACQHARSWRAEDLEAEVMQVVVGLVKDPDIFRAKIRARIDAENGRRRDPSEEVAAWMQQIAEVEARRSRLLDLAIDGAVSKDVLRVKLLELDDQQQACQQELDKARSRRQHVAEWEELEAIILDWGDGEGERWVWINWPETTPDDPDGYKKLLRVLEIRAVKHSDGRLEVDGIVPLTDSSALLTPRPSRKVGLR